MGLFGANMADFQLGLALDDKAGGYLETDEEIAQARARRPVVYHTPSTRVVSGRAGGGWSQFRF